MQVFTMTLDYFIYILVSIFYVVIGQTNDTSVTPDYANTILNSWTTEISPFDNITLSNTIYLNDTEDVPKNNYSVSTTEESVIQSTTGYLTDSVLAENETSIYNASTDTTDTLIPSSLNEILNDTAFKNNYTTSSFIDSTFNAYVTENNTSITDDVDLSIVNSTTDETTITTSMGVNFENSTDNYSTDSINLSHLNETIHSTLDYDDLVTINYTADDSITSTTEEFGMENENTSKPYLEVNSTENLLNEHTSNEVPSDFNMTTDYVQEINSTNTSTEMYSSSTLDTHSTEDYINDENTQFQNTSGLCDSSICNNHGDCVFENSSFACRCEDNWIGEHCENEETSTKSYQTLAVAISVTMGLISTALLLACMVAMFRSRQSPMRLSLRRRRRQPGGDFQYEEHDQAYQMDNYGQEN